jgi:hypothetical protein
MPNSPTAGDFTPKEGTAKDQSPEFFLNPIMKADISALLMHINTLKKSDPAIIILCYV